MANGFKALRHAGGGTQRLSEYPIASGYASSIFNGDLVTVTGGNVVLAADTDSNLGAFLGVSYVNEQGYQIFSPVWLANTVATDIKAIVSADKNVTYKVTVSAGTNQVGTTGKLVVGTGNPKTGVSAESFNADGIGTQATIRKVLPDEDGEQKAEVVLTTVIGV